MWENADQNNSEYGHFLRSVSIECFPQAITCIFPSTSTGNVTNKTKTNENPCSCIFYWMFFWIILFITDVYLGSYQTSMMEVFGKIVNG